MTTPAPSVQLQRPALPRHPLRLVLDHNPFFLLSGVSMLLGCYLINAAIHEEQLRSGGLGTGLGWLLALLAAFNLYEFLVVGLGVYLLRSRGLVRDAAYLLILEVLLLVDVGLVYNEIVTQSLTLGVATACVLGVLAAAKLAAVAWGVRLRLSRAAWTLIGLDIAAVLATPLLPRAVAAAADGQWDLLPPQTFLWLWWAAGLLLALHALPSAWLLTGGARPLTRLRRGLTAALVAAPLLSVLGHLWGAGWVYEHPFRPAYLSPVLLGGLVVYLRHLAPRSTPAFAHAVAAIVGIIAVLLSLRVPGVFITELGPLALSPLRLVLVAAAAIWLGTAYARAAWPLYALGAAALGLALLGHTPRAISDRLDRLLGYARDLFELVTGMGQHAATAGQRVVPSTTLGWGLLAVAAAFALLVAGGCVSLLKRPRA